MSGFEPFFTVDLTDRKRAFMTRNGPLIGLNSTFGSRANCDYNICMMKQCSTSPLSDQRGIYLMDDGLKEAGVDLICLPREYSMFWDAPRWGSPTGLSNAECGRCIGALGAALVLSGSGHLLPAPSVNSQRCVCA